MVENFGIEELGVDRGVNSFHVRIGVGATGPVEAVGGALTLQDSDPGRGRG